MKVIHYYSKLFTGVLIPGADAGGARARGAQHQGRRRAGAPPGQTRWDREGPSIINNAYNSFLCGENAAYPNHEKELEDISAIRK